MKAICHSVNVDGVKCKVSLVAIFGHAKGGSEY